MIFKYTHLLDIFFYCVIPFRHLCNANYRYNTFSPTPSPLDTINYLLREMKTELSDIRKDFDTKMESMKYDINCEIRDLKDDLLGEKGTVSKGRDKSGDIQNMKKRIQKTLRGISTQGDEIKSELRSHKAEMYAIRNSVYDSRDELVDKGNMVLRSLQNANGTFMCYLNDLRINLYKINTNFAMIKHDQDRLKDLIQMSQVTENQSEILPTEQVQMEVERTNADNFLPGCTTNPLETQETLKTFGQMPIYSNISMPGFNRNYSPFPTPKISTSDDIQSLFPKFPEDCKNAEKLYLEYPPMPRDCKDVHELGFMETGVYRIQPPGLSSREVMCEHDKAGGGWTIFVSRVKTFKHISFNRTWQEYKTGFGDPTSEYWIGLNTLHALTERKPYEMRADLEDWEGNKAWATYSFFSVSGPQDKYRLRVSGYSGIAGDSMRHSHLQMFSTIDQDNDQEDWGSCARGRGGGGWWWGRCACTQPTGQYRRGKYQGPERGVTWWHWKDSNYSLKNLLLKIRPKQ